MSKDHNFDVALSRASTGLLVVAACLFSLLSTVTGTSMLLLKQDLMSHKRDIIYVGMCKDHNLDTRLHLTVYL